ncbi:MAG: competence/damage-inducible protein A [Clostridia bacterium]|nr:competence/damage-inducible protein A [Clostridia bacterium]
MVSCEIISVGTELLLGDILDTNAQYLSRELAALGISVLHRSTVGDNPVRLAEEITAALSRSDYVILTGGLGPTADDITKEVCCSVMGFSLETDQNILADISAFFKAKNIPMPQSNAKQALVPVGGTVFHNDNGTAPGIAMEKDGKCAILLPGPPREMTAMFQSAVVPFLKKKNRGAIISHTVRTYGIGESAMAEKVSDLLENDNPTVAPYAKDGEALLRVTAFAETEDDAEKMILPVLEEINKRLGDYIYGTDVDSIQQALVNELRAKHLHVAFAESCTAGFISKRLTEVPGASEVFDCSIVSYSNEIKSKLLNVKEETLAEYGAVSEQTAREMAIGVREVSGADIAVSVTGIAGPDGTDTKPAGLAFIGIADKDSVRAIEFKTGRNDREYNRYVTASKALKTALDSAKKY